MFNLNSLTNYLKELKYIDNYYEEYGNEEDEFFCKEIASSLINFYKYAKKINFNSNAFLNIKDENDKLLKAWENTGVVVNVKYKDFPQKLCRKLIVPLYIDMVDFIGILLSSIRCSGEHLFKMYSNNVEFLCYDEFIDITNSKKNIKAIGHDNILNALNLTDKFTLLYDYGDSWEFDISFEGFKVFKDSDEYICRVISNSGYGILEDFKKKLDNYLSGIKVKLPVDFEDNDIEELEEDINCNYINYFNVYE